MFTYKPLVYLVDDDPAIRKALPRALRQRGLEVEAFSSAREFLDNYKDQLGCLVLDLSMPEMDGLELQAELSRLQIDIPIIFITGHGGVPESVTAIRAGAIDFLEKPFLPDTLLQRIEEALALDHENRNRNQEVNSKRERFSRLTEREQDIFKILIADDTIPSSKEIARTVGISHRTVEHHRARILEKTETGSVPELRSLVKEIGLEVSEL
jgi:FixJ family two-component response regulator